MKKFIKGLFFGAAAGTIGGLLAAPRSGKETRQHLINELEDYRSLKIKSRMTGIRCNEIWQLSKKTFHWQLNFQKTCNKKSLISNSKRNLGLLKLKNKLPKLRLNYLTHKLTSKSKVFDVNYFFCY